MTHDQLKIGLLIYGLVALLSACIYTVYVSYKKTLEGCNWFGPQYDEAVLAMIWPLVAVYFLVLRPMFRYLVHTGKVLASIKKNYK